MKHVAGGSDEVESLVGPIEDVNECEPAVLVRRRQLELFTVVPRVGASANLLDGLDRNC